MHIENLRFMANEMMIYQYHNLIMQEFVKNSITLLKNVIEFNILNFCFNRTIIGYKRIVDGNKKHELIFDKNESFYDYKDHYNYISSFSNAFSFERYRFSKCIVCNKYRFKNPIKISIKVNKLPDEIIIPFDSSSYNYEFLFRTDCRAIKKINDFKKYTFYTVNDSRIKIYFDDHYYDFSLKNKLTKYTDLYIDNLASSTGEIRKIGNDITLMCNNKVIDDMISYISVINKNRFSRNDICEIRLIE